MSQRIGLLFSDDSTLIFAAQMKELLLAVDTPPHVDLILFGPEDALSVRQMAAFLPDGPDKVFETQDLIACLNGPEYQAVITSRVYRPISVFLKDPAAKAIRPRPCLIAFLGGLDFFPHDGFMHRRHCDAVYLFPRSFVDRFETQYAKHAAHWQEVGFGHPATLTPNGSNVAAGRGSGDIYFFAQAISPSTRDARLHVLRVLAAIARANPERRVWLKLRHLPGENQRHKHVESIDYPSLMYALPTPPPPNLGVTACTMAEAIQTAGLGITCTSTAALDLLGANIPVMVYLDYVDNFADPLAAPMRELFEGSGLITPLDDVLHLRHRAPLPEWVDAMFCPRDLGARVLETAARFHASEVRCE